MPPGIEQGQSYGAQSDGAQGSRALSTPMGTLGASRPLSQGGENASLRAQNTRNKFAELGNRMSDLDQDLEGQSQVRRNRAMQIETMYSDLLALQKLTRQLDERSHSLEDSASRIDRALATEKETREVLEKTALKLVDDRYKMASARVEQEKFERESDGEVAKKRLHQLEENFSHLLETTEEERKLMRSLERQVAKLLDRMNAVQNSIESEQSKRLEEGSAAMKTLNSSLISLQSLVNSEAHVRDRELDKLKQLCAREFDDMRRLVQQERKEIDLRMSKMMVPVQEDLRSLSNDLVNEKTARENGDVTVVQKLGEQLAEVKRTIDNELRMRDDDQNLKLKAIDDRFWKVNYQLDKERDSREKADKALFDALEDEKRAREEAEEALATLLDQTIFRIKGGMELPGQK